MSGTGAGAGGQGAGVSRGPDAVGTTAWGREELLGPGVLCLGLSHTLSVVEEPHQPLGLSTHLAPFLKLSGRGKGCQVPRGAEGGRTGAAAPAPLLSPSCVGRAGLEGLRVCAAPPQAGLCPGRGHGGGLLPSRERPTPPRDSAVTTSGARRSFPFSPPRKLPSPQELLRQTHAQAWTRVAYGGGTAAVLCCGDVAESLLHFLPRQVSASAPSVCQVAVSPTTREPHGAGDFVL